MGLKVSDPMFWEKRKQDEIDSRANATARTRELGRKYSHLNKSANRPPGKVVTVESSTDEKKSSSSAVYEFLADALFDKVSFVTQTFSQTNDAGSYTGSDFNGENRVTNTSEGKFLSPEKRSRARMSFYVENPDQITAYILSPAVYDSFSSLNTFSDINILRSYSGIKIDGGIVYGVTKSAGGEEETFESNLRLSGGGATDTYRLDIRTVAGNTEVSIDSELVGTFPCNLVGEFTTVKTFLPLLAPAKSNNGSAVNLTIENFQFIQDN